MLAADPAARQLFDEFAPLGATLQDLPQQTLGEDLGDRVLQLAEHRMLTESQLPAEPVRPIAARTVVRTIVRRFVHARVLVWSGLAVAVAIA